MPTIDDYLKLVTSEHADKPKFIAALTALLQPEVDLQNMLLALVPDFDLDTAIGVQLDAVGVRIGRSRFLEVPAAIDYFSLDVPDAGLDQAIWWEPFNPTTEIVRLPDEPYRTLLRAVAAANEWDGTIPGSYAVWNKLGFTVLIQDYEDMSMIWALFGPIPDNITLALLTGPYIKLRPAGVRIRSFMTETVPFAPFFGLDVENTHIAGLDVGAWGKILPGSPPIPPFISPGPPGALNVEGGIAADSSVRHQQQSPGAFGITGGLSANAQNFHPSTGTPQLLGSSTAIGDSVTINLASGVPAGTAIIVAASAYGADFSPPPTDTGGNTWTTAFDIANSLIFGAIFVSPNTNGIAPGGSITITLGAVVQNRLAASAISVTNLGNPDGATSSIDTSTTNPLALTTTKPGDLLIGAVASQQSDGFSSTLPGFTIIAQVLQPFASISWAYMVAAPAGSQTFNPTMGAAGRHVRMFAAYSPQH